MGKKLNGKKNNFCLMPVSSSYEIFELKGVYSSQQPTKEKMECLTPIIYT